MKLRVIASIVAVFSIAIMGGLIAKSISQAKMTKETDPSAARTTDSPSIVKVNPEVSGKTETTPLATAHCFCGVKPFIGPNPEKLNDACIDLGILATYNEPFPMKEANQKDCCNKCSLTAVCRCL